MVATGIIRRIDDLGRIVIPKEIRDNMRIKSGESLEIFTNNEEIMLKKYSPVSRINNVVGDYVDAMYATIRHSIVVTDRDSVIACSSDVSREYANKTISDFVDRSIQRRDSFVERHMKDVSFIEGKEENCFFSFSSIINNSDLIGSVIIFSNDIPINEIDEKMAIVLAKMLANYFKS